MGLPLVSVVIPTYNRYKYLKECISSIITIDSDDLEIIIQDNTEKNYEIVAFLNEINDRRVKYFHIKEHISVMENSNLAVKHSSGKYVCMIGDDDTVCSSILKAAAYCEKNGYDSCCFVFPGFNWYDMTFEAKKEEANLFFRYPADGSTMKIKPRDELMISAKRGSGLTEKMPRLYHGLVGRECLNRIYAKVGTYFPGPSPDMANGTAVCLEANNTVFISDYLIVSGYGHESARGEGNRGQHYGRLDEKPWLPKDIIERWNKEIPAIFSAETIIAQSMTEALSTFDEGEYLKAFDYGRLYAAFLWHHKDAAKQLLAFCLKKPQRLFKLVHGVFQKYRERKQYFENHSAQKNYLEYQSVKTLTEAKEITEQQSALIKEYR